ncbi:MAG: hypothetical protein M3Y22_07510 [Pseudomonadota bacterium]|nr:hypothetical protein [Pseudomonadota bacterium]
MSHTIIVKIEYDEKGELTAHNFDRRYDQRIAMTAEIKQILGPRAMVFAEARLTSRGMIILRRARNRAW